MLDEDAGWRCRIEMLDRDAGWGYRMDRDASCGCRMGLPDGVTRWRCQLGMLGRYDAGMISDVPNKLHNLRLPSLCTQIMASLV